MDYKQIKYPKNKDDDYKKLSNYQIQIRNNIKKYIYNKEVCCKQCGKKHPYNYFYVKDKLTGRRNTKCKDCQMKNMGVLEIGKQRFSHKIGEKGFKRCCICKQIKPLTDYSKQKGKYLGRASNCKLCNAKRVKKLQISGRENITDWYVKEYGKRNGINKFDKEIISNLRKEILEKRKPKYFLDNQKFTSLRDFAKYIEKKYGLPISTTEKRISLGKTEEECKLSKRKMRSVSRSKSIIKVKDLVTNNVKIFHSTNCDKLQEIISASTLRKVIKEKQGFYTPYHNSNYKNPCFIEIIKDK